MIAIFIIISIIPPSFSLYSDQQNPLLNPGNLTSTPIPSYPTIQSPSSGGNLTCHLDLSSELFGGVSTACSNSSPLDRDRYCPVLAAWLFAAHARSALALLPPPPPVSSPLSDDVLPLMPDDSQKCVDSLHLSLEARNIKLPRPNATCDTVLCFCGIRLHQIGSLSCPAAFNVTAAGERAANGSGVATPTAAVKELERDCRNSSYDGCTRCLQSLEKLKGGNQSAKESSGGDRAAKMFNRDCRLMGLTWLLAKNKTVYIPTVSAVLRAVLYGTTHPPTQPYKCSPDQENMPLAVDSLQFQKLDSPSSAAASSSNFALGFSVYSLHVLLPVVLFLCGGMRLKSSGGGFFFLCAEGRVWGLYFCHFGGGGCKCY